MKEYSILEFFNKFKNIRSKKQERTGYPNCKARV